MSREIIDEYVKDDVSTIIREGHVVEFIMSRRMSMIKQTYMSDAEKKKMYDEYASKMAERLASVRPHAVIPDFK